MIHRCNCAEGERRKADALATLAKRREAVVRRAQRALLTVLLETGSATADDVRDLVDLPQGVDPKLFGAVPRPLGRAGIIRAAGVVKTCRPMAHARHITIWVLADRAAAERWLATHPEPTDWTPDPADATGDGPQRLLFPVTQETAMPTGDAAGAAS
jgi:hypothetical protein